VVPSVGVALAPSFTVLLAMRAAQGLCMPGLLTVGVPYVTEAFNERIGSRAMGMYVSALVLGGLVGRVGVALLTAATSWRVALGAVAALPLAATLVMRRSLPPETPGPPSAGLSIATLRRLLANRALVAACLTGAGLFFSFMGVFSYIDFRLERPPFSLSPALIGLIFVLWVMGAAGPLAGRLADRHGWRAVALGGLLLCAGGLTLSLVPVLAVVIVGLSLVTLGNFSAVTAAQLGVAGATDRDRGVASAMYFSGYYVAGALGAYVPGLAWEQWHWTGVWAMAIAAYAIGAGALIAAATLARPCAPSPATPADSSSSSRTPSACAAAQSSGSSPGGASSSP
jgi:YNFM family putative membrane transporter